MQPFLRSAQLSLAPPLLLFMLCRLPCKNLGCFSQLYSSCFLISSIFFFHFFSFTSPPFFSWTCLAVAFPFTCFTLILCLLHMPIVHCLRSRLVKPSPTQYTNIHFSPARIHWITTFNHHLHMTLLNCQVYPFSLKLTPRLPVG